MSQAGHRLGQLSSTHLKLFLFSLVIGVFCYGQDIFNLSYSIDEEVHASLTGPVIQWLGQDRWGMYLFNAVIAPTPTIPYMTGLIGLVSLAMCGTLAASIWSNHTLGFRAYASAAVLVSSPIFMFLMHFDTTQYGAFLGLFIGICALALFIKGSKLNAMVGWAMLVFSVSVYQAIAFPVLICYLFWVLSQVVGDDSPANPEERSGMRLLRHGFFFGLWAGSAVVMHKLISLVVRALSDPELGYKVLDDAYDGSYWKWYSVSRIWNYIEPFLFGGKWYLGTPAAVLFVLGVVLVVLRLIRDRRAKIDGLIGAGILVVAILSPFLLVIATGVTFWPTRTLLGLPMLFAGLVCVGLGSRWAAARLVYGLVVMCAIGFFVISNNRLIFADHQQWWIDKQLVFEIQKELEILRGSDRESVRVALVGEREMPDSPVRFREESIGISYFEPQHGVQNSATRLARLLEIFGSGDIAPINTPEDYHRVLEQAQAMPAWPTPGWMGLSSEGVVIIKLGEPVEKQLKYAKPSG